MPDRHAVMTEILRVLRPGGIVGIAVWSEGHRPSPLTPTLAFFERTKSQSPISVRMTLQQSPRPSARSSSCSGRGAGSQLSAPSNCRSYGPTPEAAAFGITGSTYGPGVASLSRAEQEEVFASIVKEASGEMPPAVMRAVLGRGVAGEALRGGT